MSQITLVISFLVVLSVVNPAAGQMQRAIGDEQIVKESELVAAGVSRVGPA